MVTDIDLYNPIVLNCVLGVELRFVSITHVRNCVVSVDLWDPKTDSIGKLLFIAQKHTNS